MFDALFQETLRIRQHGAEYRVKIPAAGILVGVIQNCVPPVVIQVPDHSSLCRQVEFPVIHIDQIAGTFISVCQRLKVIVRKTPGRLSSRIVRSDDTDIHIVVQGNLLCQ